MDAVSKFPLALHALSHTALLPNGLRHLVLAPVCTPLYNGLGHLCLSVLLDIHHGVSRVE